MEFKRIQAADLSQWDGSADHPEFRILLASIQSMVQHARAFSQPGASTLANASSPPAASTWPASAPPFRIEISRRAAWMSAAIFAVVALTWALYTVTNRNGSPRTTSSNDGTASNPSSPSSTTEPASPRGRGNETAEIGKRFNLLARENGGKLVVADNDRWNAMIDGEETGAAIMTSSAVFAFREERAATFDTFAVLIPEANPLNLSDFELWAGNDSPTGHFESIGKFKTINSRIIASPYQEFRFPEVKAKYLKIRALNNHMNNTVFTSAYEMALFGRLE